MADEMNKQKTNESLDTAMIDAASAPAIAEDASAQHVESPPLDADDSDPDEMYHQKTDGSLDTAMTSTMPYRTKYRPLECLDDGGNGPAGFSTNEQSLANDDATIGEAIDKKTKSEADSEHSETTVMGNVLECLTHDDDLTLNIDDRFYFRQGWPLLPAFPVATIKDSIPAKFSKSSAHMQAFNNILESAKVPTHDVFVAHRMNPGVPISKHSLTLCVLSDHEHNKHWEKGIEKLRQYILNNGLKLAVEIIDPRAFAGIYTHPILATDKALARAEKRKRRAVLDVVREAHVPFNEIYFYMRGLGNSRGDAAPTVIVGTPVPNRRVWWDMIMPKIETIMGGVWNVEVNFEKSKGY